MCVHTRNEVYTQKNDKEYTNNAKKGGQDIHKWLGDLCIHSKACMEAGPGYTHRARSIHKVDESGRSYTTGEDSYTIPSRLHVRSPRVYIHVDGCVSFVYFVYKLEGVFS